MTTPPPDDSTVPPRPHQPPPDQGVSGPVLPPNTQPPPGTIVDTPLAPTKVRYWPTVRGRTIALILVVVVPVAWVLGKGVGLLVQLAKSWESYNKIAPAVEDPRLGSLLKPRLIDGSSVDLGPAARGEMPAGKGASKELTPGQEPDRTDLADAVDQLLARGGISDVHVKFVPGGRAPQRASAEVAPVRDFGLAL